MRTLLLVMYQFRYQECLRQFLWASSAAGMEGTGNIEVFHYENALSNTSLMIWIEQVVLLVGHPMSILRFVVCTSYLVAHSAQLL